MMWKLTWKPLELLLPRKTVYRKQYHIPGRIAEICATNMELKDIWVVSPIISPVIFPIWLLRKTDGFWRMTLDHDKLNQVMPLIVAAIPNVVSLLEQINISPGTWYTAIDLSNVFCTSLYIKIHQKHFAFIWEGQIYTFTVRPLKCMDSPSLCYNLVLSGLDQFSLPQDTTLFHYIDNIMLIGPREQEIATTINLVRHLYVREWAIYLTKIQVTYASTAAAKLLQSCPTLCDLTDGSTPGSPVPVLSHVQLCDSTDNSLLGSSVHEILQARILEWVAISFPRGSSQSRNQT